MKILLINSPIRLDAKPSCIPYGLVTVAATLLKAGHDVDIYVINALRPSKDAFVSELKAKTWDAVGVSGLITTYQFQKWLIPVLKEINPKAPVITGEGLATTCSELLSDRTPVDIAVIGEGEQTMLELSVCIQREEDLAAVPGIRCRRNSHVEETPQRKNIENIDSIPFPARDLLPMEIYLENPIWGDVAGNSSGFRKGVTVTRSMNIISSRGYPFCCNYCYHLFGKSSYRYRSVQNVIDEMESWSTDTVSISSASWTTT